MEVGGTGQMTQMHTQMQMRKMDGTGGGQGQGQGGMKDIMQSLSPEDRTQLRDQMSSLSSEDRQVAVSQMKEVDPISLQGGDYLQALLDAMNISEDTSDTQYEGSVEAYA